MNNEPVAWIDKNTGKPRMEGFIQTDHDIPLYTHPAKEVIFLTKAELESGLTRVRWAEELIKQLPKEHEGRNSWLLNYGEEK